MLSNYILTLMKTMLDLLKNKLVLIKFNFEKQQLLYQQHFFAFQQPSTCMSRNTNYHHVIL